MKFGKREQIVVISLLGIGTIAFLHLMIFSPRASRFKEAIEKKKKLAASVGNIQTPSNPREIDNVNNITKALDLEYNDIFTSLGVVHPPVFELPVNPDDVKVEDMDPKPDPKKPPAPPELKKMKSDQLGAIRWKKRAPQIDLIYEQMRRLNEFDTRAGGKAAGPTVIYFLASDPRQGGLAYPFEIDKSVRGGKLTDIISHIDQTKQLLEKVKRDSKGLWEEQRKAYEESLALLGIKAAVFRDFAPLVKNPNGSLKDYGSLAAKGEYMPLLVKLRWAMLLEETLIAAAKEAVRAAGGDPEKATLADNRFRDEPVTRDRIFQWLEISPPYDPLPAAGLKDAEIYYLYLQLYYLNYLLETMVKPEHAVAEIYSVTFDDIAYQRSFLSIANPEEKMPEEKPKEPRKNYYAIAPPEEGMPTSAPFEAAVPTGEDLAFAIPVTIQFKVHNRNAWILAYDITRDNPLASIERMDIRGGGAGGDVFVDATFVFVPRFVDGTPKAPKVFVPPPKTPTPAPPPSPAPKTPAPAAAAPGAPGAAATPASRLGPAVR